jgi:hypothetical protein
MAARLAFSDRLAGIWRSKLIAAACIRPLLSSRRPGAYQSEATPASGGVEIVSAIAANCARAA